MLHSRLPLPSRSSSQHERDEAGADSDPNRNTWAILVADSDSAYSVNKDKYRTVVRGKDGALRASTVSVAVALVAGQMSSNMLVALVVIK